MESELLKSVIRITKSRDVDSLEYSLLATLAELIPCDRINIYRIVNDDGATYIEQALSLLVRRENGRVNVSWRQTPRAIKEDPQIISCLETGEMSTGLRNTSEYQLVFPIICDHKVVSALELFSDVPLDRYTDKLEAMIRIYENYLYILDESEKDSLTGLFNRRTFDQKLERLLQTQRNRQLQSLCSIESNEKRQLKPYSEAWLAIVDIDHFKRINDQYGHVFGDGVLLLLSNKMRQCFRQTDYIFRFGGEEFVVILEPLPDDFASQTLERLRKTIETHTFPLVGKVTVSIGYAKITDNDYPPAVLDSADKALYYAKEQGRNRVFNYESLVRQGEISQTQLGVSIGF
ncbi:GGDEF domain-containing protein [Aliikangiella sp. G2MR2-5]|uniref:GGDEF domain-containing protein n=1 Tax=Aliikangiella sp. G2MR2-5 TaxID=2788943 RepID=UPI0018A8ADBF|nr:GGDEF domain-containing protein [Aliikangiella sp. G2MR2-5]